MPDTNARLLAMPSPSDRRRRLAMTYELQSAILDTLERIDYDLSKPLEMVHGSFTIEIVKGRFQRVTGGPSILLDQKQTRKAS